MSTPYAQDLSAVLQAAANRLNLQLSDDVAAWRGYAGERMLHLSTILDQRGYQEAVVNEAINVALVAAGSAVDDADALDREFLGIVIGGLTVGARALAGVP